MPPCAPRFYGRLSTRCATSIYSRFGKPARLARGTIVNAFEHLRSEGYVESSVGSGTYVNRVLPERLLHVAPGHTRGGTFKSTVCYNAPITPCLQITT
jgi:hypothetical protein